MGKELFEGRTLLKQFFNNYLTKLFDDGKENRSFLSFRNKQREQDTYCPKIILFSGENGLGKTSAINACIDSAENIANEQKKSLIKIAINWDSWYLKKGFIPLTIHELLDALYEQFSAKNNEISTYFSAYKTLCDKLKGISKQINELKIDEWPCESEDILPENEHEEFKLWLKEKLTKQDLETFEKAEAQLTEILIQGLKDCAMDSLVILSVDNYDYLTPELDEWFRTSFLSKICNDSTKIVSIISGNSNLTRGFRNVFKDELLYNVNFSNITLSLSEIAHLAKIINLTLTNEQCAEIEQYSAGTPIVVKDILNYLKTNKPLGDIIDTSVSEVWNIQEQADGILNRMLSFIDDASIKEKVFHLAMTKKHDIHLLSDLWEINTSEYTKVIADLSQRFAFIESDHIHILLRSCIRTWLIQNLSSESNLTLKELFENYSTTCSLLYKDEISKHSSESPESTYHNDKYLDAVENYVFGLFWGSSDDALSFILGLYIELVYFNPEFASNLLWGLEEFHSIMSEDQLEVIDMLNSGLVSSDRDLFRKKAEVQPQEQAIFDYLDKNKILLSDFQQGLLELKLGELKYRKGDLSEAMEKFQSANAILQNLLPNSSLIYESFFLIGNEFKNSENYASAIDAYNNVIKIKPQHFFAWNNLGFSYLALREYKSAADSLCQATNINSENQNIWYNLGLSYAAIDKHQDAVDAFKLALEKGPATHDLWFNLGNSLEKAEKFSEAAEAYKKVVAILPEDDEAWYLLGKCYTALKQSTDAINAYKKAIAIRPDFLLVLNAMGSEYIEQKMYDNAAKTFETAVELDNENDQLWVLAAQAWHDAGKFEQSIDDASKAIALNKESSISWIIIGNNHTALANFEDALCAYQNASKIDANNPLIWNHIGNTYYSQGDFDNAITAFRKAVAIDPATKDAYFNIGLACQVKKNYTEAIEAFKEAVVYNPSSAECWFQKGRVHMILEQYEDAIESLSEMIKRVPDSHDAWYRKGISCAKIGRHTDAIEAFQKAGELLDSDSNVWFNMGLSYCAESLLDKAIEAFTKATKLNKTKPEIWLNLGNTYKKLNQFEPAIDAYQKTCELLKDSAEAWIGLGMCQYFLEKYNDAKTSLKKALELEPDNIDIIYHLALTCHAIGEYEKAIFFYQHITELQPSHQDAWYNMALAYHGTEEFAKAIDVYKLTVSRWPENGSAWNNLGIAYHAIGELDNAVNAYRSAAKIEPQNSDIWYNLGIAYHSMEQYGEAIQAYRKVVRLSPNNYDALHNLGLSYYVWGHYDDAIEAYTKASLLKPDSYTIWGNMAVTYFDSKNYDKSVESALKALKINKDEKWLLGYLIVSSVILGKKTEATEYANQLFNSENSLHEIATAILLLEECKKNNPELDGIYDLILKLQSYSEDPEVKNKSIENDEDKIGIESITDTDFDKEISNEIEEIGDIEIGEIEEIEELGEIGEISIEPDNKE